MKSLSALLAAAALCALSGCTVSSSSVMRYSDAPVLPPTQAWVPIARVEPHRPYEKLGELTAETRMNPALATEDLEARLRAGGQSLGADAVVVTSDRILPLDDDITIPGATRRGDTDWKRRLTAIAIKYRDGK
jgi:hypothetical protein